MINFGDNTNPPFLIFSMTQSRMHHLQNQGDWQGIAKMAPNGAQAMQRAGAELLMICLNTIHKVLKVVKPKIDLPFLHIGDVTARHIISQGYHEAGFTGTRFGMEDPFLTHYIKQCGVDIVLPEFVSSISEFYRIIHEGLTYNKVTESSKIFVANEIEQLQAREAQGIILGCTEFSLMFEKPEIGIPVFDTVKIHALTAVSEILKDE